MNLPRSKKFWNDLPPWAQWSLIATVWLLISLMCPRGVRFDYSFEQGQRWRYSDLIAPFDFPLRKYNAEIAAERRLAKAGTDPYFEFVEGEGSRAMGRYRERFGESLAALPDTDVFGELRQRPDRYLRIGAELLVRAYERGIVAETPQLNAPPNGIVRVVRGGTIFEEAPEQLLNVTLVRAQLQDSLRRSGLRDAGFLVPIVQSVLTPNVIYSDSLTGRFAETRMDRIVESRGMVRNGEVIVAENGIITEEVFQKLRSYKIQYESEVIDLSRRWVMFLGYAMLVGVIMSLLLLYLRTFHREEFYRFNRLAFLLLLMLVAIFAVYRIEALTTYGIYVMPFVLIPIIVKSFYASGVALFTHLVTVLVAGFITTLGYEFTFLQLIAGIVAVLVPTDVMDSGSNLRLMAVLLLTYFVGFVGLEFVKEGSWSEVDWVALTWLALGLLLSLLAGPLIPLFGRLFGFTSDIAYRELADVNRPVLRDLALRAPGTFQHSLAVSNLAESAVREIGGDALLVKVAALYHDIGKTVDPLYFIENQSGRNPHEQLDEKESARIIISHVAEGARLARAANLPQEIIDFILTHHGTTRVEYFYRTYVNKNPDLEVDAAAFRYPGPLPTSREQGVMMIADSVEAAGRALKDPTTEGIDRMVDGLIDAKMALGQFYECALSFAELEQCRLLFKRMLKSMYHARVEYPEAEAVAVELSEEA